MCLFWYIKILKNTPGKLINILLKPSSETSPRIPVHKREIKTLKTEDALTGLPLEQAHAFLPSFFPSCVTAFFLLSSNDPGKTCNQGKHQAVAAHPRLTLWSFQNPLFSDFFVSWQQPCLSSLQSLWLLLLCDSMQPIMAHFFPITFLVRQNRAPHRLSPFTSSLLSPSFVSLSPAVINVLSKSPGLMLWTLSCMKSRTHTLPASPRQTHSRPGAFLVT